MRVFRQAFFEYPRVIGHELCVTILEVPETEMNPQNVKPGDASTQQQSPPQLDSRGHL